MKNSAVTIVDTDITEKEIYERFSLKELGFDPVTFEPIPRFHNIIFTKGTYSKDDINTLMVDIGAHIGEPDIKSIFDAFKKHLVHDRKLFLADWTNDHYRIITWHD